MKNSRILQDRQNKLQIILLQEGKLKSKMDRLTNQKQSLLKDISEYHENQRLAKMSIIDSSSGDDNNINALDRTNSMEHTSNSDIFALCKFCCFQIQSSTLLRNVHQKYLLASTKKMDLVGIIFSVG